jgi:hypothetical protein
MASLGHLGDMAYLMCIYMERLCARSALGFFSRF